MEQNRDPRPHEEINPYAAPAVELERDREPENRDESIRRSALDRESSVMVVGLYRYLFANHFGCIASAYIASASLAIAYPGRYIVPASHLVKIALFILACLSSAIVGHGLRRLRPWALRAEMALTAFILTLLGVMIFKGLLKSDASEVILADVSLAIYVAIALPARPFRTEVVFTPEYRGAIERTPYIRPKLRLRTRIFLGLFLLFQLSNIGASVYYCTFRETMYVMRPS